MSAQIFNRRTAAINQPWLGKAGALHPRSKPVIQIFADGTTARHDGVSDAARATHLSFKHISACCLGKRQRHGGFQWRFAQKESA